MKFSVDRLRFVADKMRDGVFRAAELHLILRFRGRPLSEVPKEYHSHLTKLGHFQN
jgi:hypothetical protein